MIKLGFLGTPEISAYVLQSLVDHGFDVAWVLTQPDKKSGRGLKVNSPAVKVKAEELGIKVFQSEVINRDLYSVLSGHKVDLCVVVAYGAYIPTYFIEGYKMPPLNIHVSLLPKYRGAAPVARAIMNGDSVAGVTIMQIDKEMDAGAIVAQDKIEISDSDNTGTLTWKLIKRGTELLISAIPDYLNGRTKTVSQSDVKSEPSYAEKIKADERLIDWSSPAKTIHDKVRALYPWPVAETKLDGVNIKIIKTSWQNEGASAYKGGEIIEIKKKEGLIVVATNDGVVLVEKVQPSGKREMTVSEFINGHKINKGMRFQNV